jgi:hypothetical protein
LAVAVAEARLDLHIDYMGYIVVYSQSTSSEMHFPDVSERPVVYRSLDDAMNGMNTLMKDMNITRILYGEVFPYENTTFEQHLSTHGFAYYAKGSWMDGDLYTTYVGLRMVDIV